MQISVVRINKYIDENRSLTIMVDSSSLSFSTERIMCKTDQSL